MAGGDGTGSVNSWALQNFHVLELPSCGQRAGRGQSGQWAKRPGSVSGACRCRRTSACQSCRPVDRGRAGAKRPGSACWELPVPQDFETGIPVARAAVLRAEGGQGRWQRSAPWALQRRRASNCRTWCPAGGGLAGGKRRGSASWASLACCRMVAGAAVLRAGREQGGRAAAHLSPL